ncbi:MAG TPA: phage protein GemA/Gp16 family protein [Tepidisphaeraceae bacterium]|jgi:hypothetical protein
MTRKQIIFIQQAKRMLQDTCGLDEGWYRQTLKIAGGVDSSTKLDNAGFERVMAAFEGMGFRDPAQQDRTRAATYWRDAAAMQNVFASRREVALIRELVAQTKYADGLEGLCRVWSNRRTSHVAKLRPKEAHNVIEMLKAVIERQSREVA